MIFLLNNPDGGHYEIARDELGISDGDLGQLMTPLARNRNIGRLFAIDNGAFSHFDEAAFFSLLHREEPNRERCLFVVVPDMVCQAQRTLELFRHYLPRLHGWPLALACQNGQENLPIPWEYLSAVFIGGDDRWKTSDHARAIVRTAKIMGKWAHAGRVNGPVRLEVVDEWGTDSIDGTGIARYSHMRCTMAAYRNHPKLDFGLEKAWENEEADP